MKKRIVVTGAGGFIGGHLAKHFAEQGHNVVAVDKKPFDKWYQCSRDTGEAYPCFDLAQEHNCRWICEGADEVYQLAADMGGMGFIERNRIECMRSVLINVHMLQAACDAGVSKYFFSSSACAYNVEKQQDVNVTALKESDAYPAMAERGYGWEKLYSEMLCQEYAAERGMQTYIARFHNVYGPHGTWRGGREKAPAALCRKIATAALTGGEKLEIWGDGNQTRSFMWVGDCIEGIGRIVNESRLVATPINLGSSELVSINRMASMIERIAGVNLEWEHDLSAPKGVIQHIWEKDGKPFAFTSKAEADSVLSPTAVIFHRCKDGSLIDALAGDSLLRRVGKAIGLVKDEPKSDLAMVCLGRYGDIANALPIAKFIADTRGAPPAFIVGSDCADILEGVSYVRPVVYVGHYSDVNGALSRYRDGYKEIMVAQMYGNAAAVRGQTCFLKDVYSHLGMLPWYGRLPLVFDRRDRRREKALVKQFIVSGKRNVLVNLSGYSSPFPEAASALWDIQRRWGDCMNVVDLAGVKAEKVYDLLGLFDAADVLVTTDTATLHLARASKIKTAAILADKPDGWYGSEVKHAACSIRYGEWPCRREEIHDAIASCMDADRPLYWHVYPDFIGSGDSKRRNELAFESWKVPYSTGRFRPVPVHDAQLQRMWTKDGGKRLPFLKDVVEHAALAARPQDWVLLTNTDTCFVSNIVDRLDSGLGGVTCGYSHRRDFQRLERLLTAGEAAAGQRYVGKDLFVFRRSWWEGHRNEMPDMIYGAEGWDALLSILIDESGGKAWDDIIYHERHGSYWEKAENRYSVPSQLWCLDLAKKFCVEHRIDPSKHGFK